MELSNEYIAGFFDGEGCVYLQRQKRVYGTYVTVQVLIGQKDPEVLYLIQKRFGGKIEYKGKIKTRKFFIFVLKFTSAKQSVPFLEAIQPYCVVKVKDVRIGLEILKNVDPKRRGFKRNHISVEEQQIKEKLYQEYLTHRKRFLEVA